MAAPYSNILTKLETAAQVVYAATASPATQFTGIDDATRTVPNVTFIAELGDEFPQASGNYNVTLRIQVVTNVDDSGANTHAALAATVFDVFLMDNLAATLSATATDFHVIGIKNPRHSERTEARLHISELTLECLSCATDL